jgi:hypothetical protein
VHWPVVRSGFNGSLATPPTNHPTTKPPPLTDGGLLSGGPYYFELEPGGGLVCGGGEGEDAGRGQDYGTWSG